MAEIINLNRARKVRDSIKNRAKATENTVKFGRRKDDKELDRAKAKKARRNLDGHRRDGQDLDGPDLDGHERE